jgi:hypothetical protein
MFPEQDLRYQTTEIDPRPQAGPCSLARSLRIKMDMTTVRWPDSLWVAQTPAGMLRDSASATLV